MPIEPKRIAIQSWCFRHFRPLPDFIQQLRASGATATEVCGVHADFSAPASAGEVMRQFKSAGVEVVAIGVEKMTGNDAKDLPRFEWCKAAGVKQMSITFAPELMEDKFAALQRVHRLAETFDISLGIHNHGGYDWLGNDVILDYVFRHVGPRIGLYLDTAWALDAGMDPVQMAERFGQRLVGVHVKDFVFDRAGKPEDVVIGKGALDLPKLLATLQRVDYRGPVVIEYEGDETNPVPALRECVDQLLNS